MPTLRLVALRRTENSTDRRWFAAVPAGGCVLRVLLLHATNNGQVNSGQWSLECNVQLAAPHIRVAASLHVLGDPPSTGESGDGEYPTEWRWSRERNGRGSLAISRTFARSSRYDRWRRPRHRGLRRPSDQVARLRQGAIGSGPNPRSDSLPSARRTGHLVLPSSRRSMLAKRRLDRWAGTLRLGGLPHPVRIAPAIDAARPSPFPARRSRTGSESHSITLDDLQMNGISCGDSGQRPLFGLDG